MRAATHTLHKYSTSRRDRLTAVASEAVAHEAPPKVHRDIVRNEVTVDVRDGSQGAGEQQTHGREATHLGVRCHRFLT